MKGEIIPAIIEASQQALLMSNRINAFEYAGIYPSKENILQNSFIMNNKNTSFEKEIRKFSRFSISGKIVTSDEVYNKLIEVKNSKEEKKK